MNSVISITVSAERFDALARLTSCPVSVSRWEMLGIPYVWGLFLVSQDASKSDVYTP